MVSVRPRSPLHLSLLSCFYIWKIKKMPQVSQFLKRMTNCFVLLSPNLQEYINPVVFLAKYLLVFRYIFSPLKKHVQPNCLTTYIESSSIENVSRTKTPVQKGQYLEIRGFTGNWQCAYYYEFCCAMQVSNIISVFLLG